MTILGWIVYILGSLGFGWVEFQDAKWSNYYDLTTTGEASWWSRGKDGYFSLKKSLIITGLFYAIFGIGFAFVVPATGWEYGQNGPLFSGIFLGAVAAIIWFGVIAKNVKKHKQRRTEQLAILAKIKQDPDNAKVYLGDATYFSGHDQKTYWVFKHFYDLRALSTFQIPKGKYFDRENNIGAARLIAESEMLPRFVALAKLDTSQHFDRDRAKKV